MKKKAKNTSPTISRIEIDEKTAEPKIVPMPEKEYLRLATELSEKDEVDVSIEKADFVEENSSKSIGKQLAMERFLGVKEQDKTINKRQKIFKRIFTSIFVVFVIGVLAFTFYNDFFGSGKEYPPVEEVMELLKYSWFYIILCLLCLFLNFFFKALKISIMCKSTTGRFHFKTCFETSIIGSYYNNVTPYAAGGQPFEIYHLSKHGVHGGAAASLPIASFFMSQIAFVILTTISLIMLKYNTLGMPQDLLDRFPPLVTTMAIIGLVFCFLGPTVVVIFSLMPRVGARLVHFVMKIGDKLRIVKNPKEMTAKTIKTVVHNAHCLKKIARNPIVLISSFILSFLEYIATASIAFFSLKLFGFQLPGVNIVMEWLMITSTCLILYVAVSVVPTPGNAGAADLSFYLIFEFGLAAGLGLPAMLAWRFFSFYMIIIVGFLFATFSKKADLKRERFEAQFSGTKVMHADPINNEENNQLNQETLDTIKSISSPDEIISAEQFSKEDINSTDTPSESSSTNSSDSLSESSITNDSDTPPENGK